MLSIFSEITPKMADAYGIYNNVVKRQDDGSVLILSYKGELLDEFESEQEYLADCKMKELSKLLRAGKISEHDFENEMRKL